MPRRLITPSWYRQNHWLNLVVVLGVVVILAGVIDNALAQRHLAQNLKKAICTLRAERVRAVRTGQAFLKAHPHGTPDISRQDIEASLKLQRETIHAFSYAHCDPVPES